MIWVFLAAVLLVLALVPVGLRVRCQDGDWDLWLTVAWFRKSLEDHAPNQENSSSGSTKKASTAGKKRKGSSPLVRAAMDHWQEILSLVGRVLTAPTLELLQMEVQVGDPDPAQCAVRYGQICGAVGCVLPVLENTFQIKKRSIHTQCAFEQEDSSWYGEVIAILRVYEIVVLAVALLGLGIKILLQARTMKKAVSNDESSSS